MEDKIAPLAEELYQLALNGKIGEAKKFYWANIHKLVEKRFDIKCFVLPQGLEIYKCAVALFARIRGIRHTRSA